MAGRLIPDLMTWKAKKMPQSLLFKMVVLSAEGNYKYSLNYQNLFGMMAPLLHLAYSPLTPSISQQ